MKRFKHSLSHYKLLTCDMGELIPVGCVEVLPGDTFQHRTSLLMRLTPLVSPVMHPVTIRLHNFFVPNRLVWDQWEDFITGKDPELTVPTANTVAGVSGRRLPDYLGVANTPNIAFNELPRRAYNLIFNEWYRDQDLVSEVTPASTSIERVSWSKDYFTTARPWPQKGPSVTLPLGSQAPIIGLGVDASSGQVNPPASRETSGQDQDYGFGWDTDRSNLVVRGEQGDDYPKIYADLSDAEAINILDLREAFALQRYQEARARYGSRYTEYLRYLGVTPSDARLQRPEYLGGGRATISFSEVLQTAADDIGQEQTPVGTMRGHGIAAMRSRRYRRFFEEHGHVLTLMSVVPKAIYDKAMPRNFLRRTKEDYWQKELENIGQQEIYEGEIWQEDGGATMFDTFGYADRYREYREQPSQIHQEFQNFYDFWHLGRQFSDRPVLNESFVDCNPSKRIFAEQTQHSLLCMVNHSLQARRMVNRTAHARIT